MVNNDNFHVGEAVLREQALSISCEIQSKVGQISLLQDKLGELATEVASAEENLEWIVAARSACTDVETAGSGDVTIVAD